MQQATASCYCLFFTFMCFLATIEGLSNSDQYQYQHKNVRIQRSAAQGKPQTCTDQQLDQLKSQFLLITGVAWKLSCL